MNYTSGKSNPLYDTSVLNNIPFFNYENYK